VASPSGILGWRWTQRGGGGPSVPRRRRRPSSYGGGVEVDPLLTHHHTTALHDLVAGGDDSAAIRVDSAKKTHTPFSLLYCAIRRPSRTKKKFLFLPYGATCTPIIRKPLSGCNFIDRSTPLNCGLWTSISR
jgi:hypothetical protein